MERFGKYELVKKIGQGGMAEVFLARASLAQGLEKYVVVKKIHSAFSVSPHFLSMFVEEARIAMDLNHPNVVQVFDFGHVGDIYYLVMEYVEGADLMRTIKQAHASSDPLPHGLSCYIIGELLKGLDYAHRKTTPRGEPLDIVHRDVSPQNILISLDGAVKLVDFGIAKARTQHEEEGVVKGKFAYMAPEQASGQAVDRRSDIFAAGIILYEMLVGRTLFGGLKGDDALQTVRAAQIPAPRTINPDVPDELADIVMQALARRPADRFPSAREFQHQLVRYLHSLDQIYDSGALAAFVTRVLPREERKSVDDIVSEVRAAHSRGPQGLPGDVDTGDRALSSGPEILRGEQTAESPAIVERKKVLVVCAQPNVSDDDAVLALDPRRLEALDRFTDVASDIAFKFDVRIDAFTATHLTATVGLAMAREDDAARAIEFARAINDAFTATCRDVGSQATLGTSVARGLARTTRVSQETINSAVDEDLLRLGTLLASRAGPGEILVDDSVRRACADEFEFVEVALRKDELLAAEPSGDDAPEPPTGRPPRASVIVPDKPSRPTSWREAPTAPAKRLSLADLMVEPGEAPVADTTSHPSRVFRLVGRATERGAAPASRLLAIRQLELKEIQDAFWDVQRAGHLRVVGLLGDTGMGKRTLVRSFLAKLRNWPGQIVQGSARPWNAVIVRSLVAELARQLAGLASDASGRAIVDRAAELTAALAAGRDDRSPVHNSTLALLLGAEPPEGLARRDPDQLRQELLYAFYRLVEWRERDKPLLIVVENLHLASTSSHEHLREIVRRLPGRRILILFTAQSREGETDLLGELQATPILVGELGPEERRELVLSHFSTPGKVTELADQIIARGGGNPYYLNAILENLIEQGVCVPDPDDSEGRLRWTRQEAQVQIPATVESLVASRLDRLPVLARNLLRHAAVFGRAFDRGELRQLLEEARAESGDSDLASRVDALLEQLTERKLIRPVMETDDRFVFEQQVIQEVAYGGLAPERRRELHLHAAQILLRDPRYRPGAGDARVARQLQRAGEDRAAADKYLAASRYARNVSGNREAYQLLSMALELVPDDHTMQFAIHKEREQIQRGWGRRRQQEAEIRAMKNLAAQTGAPEMVATALVRELRFVQDGGAPKRALELAEPARAAAETAGHPVLEADALRLRARALNDLGQNDAALAAVSEALALCPDTRPGLRLRGELLHTQGNIQFLTGKLEPAITSYAEALVIFRKLDFKRLEATMLMNIGFVSQSIGDFEEALRYYQESYNIDLQIGDRFYTGTKLANIGQTYLEMGLLARAERYLSKALQLCRVVEDTTGLADALITIGQLHLKRDQPELAIDKLRTAQELAEQTESAYLQMRARIYLAFALAGRSEDETSEALHQAKRATELGRQSRMPQGTVFGLLAQSRALRHLRRLKEARERSEEALARIESGAQIVGVEEVLLGHAEILTATGDTAEAVPFLERALAEVEAKAARLGSPERKRAYLDAPPARHVAQAHAAAVARDEGEPITS